MQANSEDWDSDGKNRMNSSSTKVSSTILKLSFGALMTEFEPVVAEQKRDFESPGNPILLPHIGVCGLSEILAKVPDKRFCNRNWRLLCKFEKF